MNAVVQWGFVPIAFVCVLQLCVGLTIGYVLAGLRRGGQESADRKRRQHADGHRLALPQPERLRQQEIEHIIQQVARLAAISTGHGAAVPDSLADAIRELGQAVRELQQHAGHELKRPIANFDLSGAELDRLANTPQSDPAQGHSPHRSERLPYRVPQFVAPMQHGRLPSPDDFQPVICNDISVGGVSLFSDDLLVAQTVVMTLGDDGDRIFLVAEVINRRLVERDGQSVYLVGCRFLKRLTMREDGGQLASYLKSPSMKPLLT